MAITVDRRTVLLGTTATLLGAAAVSMIGSKATAQTLRIRPAAHTKEGALALASYRTAVGVMRQRSVTNPFDPTGWTYQALIHGIVMRIQKQTFIDGVMFRGVPASDPARQLADACWSTCPHGTIDFLPWHRIYVYFFEKIVREASGDPSFVLPYWDYSQGGAIAELPEAFREPVNGSPLNNALYNHARDPGMNGLFGPPSQVPASDTSLDALRQPLFEDPPEGSGFSSALENIPHGLIHVDVGGTDDIGFGVGDMSTTNTAGRDAIFWLHHSNMDRLWESWLKSGGETTQSYSDRAWYTRKWTFANEVGARTDISLEELNAILATEPIGYDRYETIPRDPLPMAVAGAVAGNRIEAEADEPIALSPKGNRIEFGAEPLASLAIAAAPPVHSAQVVIEDVTVTNELAVAFDVYLNLPEGGEPDPTRLVGSFSFFGAVHEGMSHPKRFVFDATDMVKKSMADGTWPASPSVTVLPRHGFLGQPARVGNVRLVIE